MRSIIALLASLFFVVAMSASNPLRGRLLDFKNKPIKSAKIYVRGSKKYIKTDKQGRFIVENIEPDDTIYVKWRGQVYDIPVDSCLGMSIKFDREPFNVEYADMGIMGQVRDSYNGRTKRYVPITTALDIMKKEAWKSSADNVPGDDMTFTSEPFNGHLYDYKGKPIKNARVYTRDPEDYVKTDKQGKFVLYDVFPSDTVFVKWKGYIYDIPVEGGRGMSVKFGKDYPKRRDFVDTGKGLIDANSYNGPRDVRTAKQLEATGESDLIQALKGIPGVFVGYDKNTGKSKISIRGFGDPLWIIDGVEMTEFPDLTVMEVERVEILKDGSFYGSRGGGGVIVVTTKGSNGYEVERY